MGEPETAALEALPRPTAPDGSWPLLDSIPRRLAEHAHTRDAYRELLVEAQSELKARFLVEEPIESLVRARAALIDVILHEVWSTQLAEAGARWALVAVGGYGRAELHPSSDIDLLILVPTGLDPAGGIRLESFLAFLWDIGLEVGHSVRTVEECIDESRADVSVITTLIESRLLEGDAALLEAMRIALGPDRLWPVRQYFDAKVQEQADRHLKANDTAYNLEPNVKIGPGGLRDIQTIAWVAKRHFGAHTLDELATSGFLSRAELRRLKQAQAFLWKVRFGLHVLTGRREDRLLFDYQIRLAQMFGYEDASYTLAVEQFMQRYYRTVMEVSLLNELLLQLFREAILTERQPPRPLNPRFQVRNEYLETVDDDVFDRTPSAILELFLIMSQHSEIRGVRASTIRAVTSHLWLIDEEFRQNPRNHRLFLEILRAPSGVTHQLRRMNTYGVLGRYITAFGRIVGRMQYDLFHAYTVDAHILFVLRNLRRMALPRFDHELPLLSSIMQQLPKQEIIYLAALFHDIAKGRGGDHSELGSVDAESFCLEQGLSRYDARLVAWLVRNHLQLSITAQKQDITDPTVVSSFARRVGDEVHLDYLYVLTVADVRATNPRLWNSWKASLFQEFYERVKRALRRGLETPVDREELIKETQERARQLLAVAGVTPDEVTRTWARLSEAYFLRHTSDELAWHTRVLALRDPDSDEPVVALEPESERGSTAVLTFAPQRYHGFARATAVLDQLGLTIVDARITPTDDGFSLDVYHVLEEDGSVITDAERLGEIERALWRSLRHPEDAPASVSRRAPRQVRMFNTATQVIVSHDERNRRSVVELVAGDRPGLLFDVAKVLMEERVELLGAKIMTVGERAEDVFYVSDRENQPLSGAAAEQLQERLSQALNRPAGARA
jgi:[protein-PII] uridylyltransferase